MEEYVIIISDEAMMDIDGVYNHIANEINQKETAYHYKAGLIAEIQKLSVFADSIGFNPYIQALFGWDARHITYKKMSIIYVIYRNVVFVKLVIAS